jgi:hypothetical protein
VYLRSRQIRLASHVRLAFLQNELSGQPLYKTNFRLGGVSIYTLGVALTSVNIRLSKTGRSESTTRRGGNDAM